MLQACRRELMDGFREKACGPTRWKFQRSVAPDCRKRSGEVEFELIQRMIWRQDPQRSWTLIGGIDLRISDSPNLLFMQ